MYGISSLILISLVALSVARGGSGDDDDELMMMMSRDDDQTTLELVQIVFRHGDRTPVVVYPNDPYNASFWRDYGGLGQLTPTGMQQHYEYGQFLRERYDSFLGPDYDRDHVFVRSTDYDRTLMSASSLLASLYKPRGEHIFEVGLDWQPIPVRTTDADKIFTNTDKCDRYNQLKYETTQSDEYKQLTQQYQDVIDIVLQKSGYKSMTLMDIWMICDDVFVQRSHNLSLPDWVEEYYDKFMELRDVGFYLDFRVTEMAKIASGGVLNEINKNIQQRIHQKSQYKLVLFSSHDTYVAGITKLLNLTEHIRQPPYASSVIFELRRSKSDFKYFIRTYLKNNTADEAIQFRPVIISGCDDELCPLDTFNEIIKNKTVDDFSAVCRKSGSDNGISNLINTTFIVSVVFIALIGFLVATASIKLCRRASQDDIAYQRQEL